MPKFPPTIAGLPTKAFPSPLTIGTDICHIPRILRLLTSNPRPGVGWQFARKIMGEEELENCRHVFEAQFERHDALKRSMHVARGFRRKVNVKAVEGKGGKDIGEVRELLGKGFWELGRPRPKMKAKLKATGDGEKGASGEGEGEVVSKEGLLIGMLRNVVNWKKYNGMEAVFTPWEVVRESVSAGKGVEDVTTDVIDALKVLSGKGEGGHVKELKDLKSPSDQSGKETVAEDASGVYEVPELEGEMPLNHSMKASTEDPSTRAEAAEQIQSAEHSTKDPRKLEQLDLPEGLHDDISVFLEIESQLQKHLSQAEALLQNPAIFLAGRFAAKEAIMKAHHCRRLTYHDTVILKQPPNEHGTQPPLAFVLGEGEAREVRFSISHDGEYATATALACDGNGGGDLALREGSGKGRAAIYRPLAVKPVEEKPLAAKPAEEKLLDKKPLEKRTLEKKPVVEKPLEVRKVTTKDDTRPVFLW